MGTPPATDTSARPDPAPSFRETVRVFATIGLQSFGGPAAQIALKCGVENGPELLDLIAQGKAIEAQAAERAAACKSSDAGADH